MSSRSTLTISEGDILQMERDHLWTDQLENLGAITGEGDIWLNRLLGGRERIAQEVRLHFPEWVIDEFLPAVDLFGTHRVVLGILAAGVPAALREPISLTISAGLINHSE